MGRISYGDVVNLIERLKLDRRWSVASYYIGFFGRIDKELYDFINKAYEDGFLK